MDFSFARIVVVKDSNTCKFLTQTFDFYAGRTPNAIYHLPVYMPGTTDHTLQVLIPQPHNLMGTNSG